MISAGVRDVIFPTQWGGSYGGNFAATQSGFAIAHQVTRWWFPIFFIFTPIWGRFPFWLIFFRWVETTNQVNLLSANGMSGGSGIWPADYKKSPVQFLADAYWRHKKMALFLLFFFWSCFDGCCYIALEALEYLNKTLFDFWLVTSRFHYFFDFSFHFDPLQSPRPTKKNFRWGNNGRVTNTTMVWYIGSREPTRSYTTTTHGTCTRVSHNFQNSDVGCILLWNHRTLNERKGRAKVIEELGTGFENVRKNDWISTLSSSTFTHDTHIPSWRDANVLHIFAGMLRL